MRLATMMRKAEANVSDWNAKHAIGTKVIVTKDDGTKLETTTRSQAWNLCGTAVVQVNGISGGYMLSRVKAVAP